MQVEATAKSQAGANYYAANGNGINTLGRQVVKGTSDAGIDTTVDFDVGDRLTRPLMPIYEMLTKRNRVVYDLGEGSYIMHKPSGKNLPLRLESMLFYLDMWAKVPRALSKHPFAWQVEEQ